MVYDRPGSHFSSVTLHELHDFFKVLGKKEGYQIFCDGKDENATIFTQVNEANDVCLRHDRPAFVVSSTSWTEDEDFSILLNALQG